MPLIATMLAGSCDAAPTRAVASVLDWVDQLLVVDSGLSTEHLAAIQAQAGEKFRHVRFAWPHDFAAARNFALEQATQLGGRWAVTIDTDEQLRFPGYANQAELLAALESRPEVRSWYVPRLGGQYAKDRFIRLPTNLRWCARVHEYLSGAAKGERAGRLQSLSSIPMAQGVLAAPVTANGYNLGPPKGRFKLFRHRWAGEETLAKRRHGAKHRLG